MEKIVSKNNEKIKHVSKLISSSSLRKKEKLFFIEGIRICLDAVASGVAIRQTFVTNSSLGKYYNEIETIIHHSDETYEVSNEVFSKISDTGSPQGIACVCRWVENLLPVNIIEKGKNYVMLENIQDPSNLGAICRTAEALGIDGAVICGGCDIFNPKVLRGSMGSIFRLPIYEAVSFEDFFKYAKNNNLKIFTTVTDKTAKKITDISFTSGAVCVIGNEGNGVSDQALMMCDEKVTIPMLGRAQSLNASMAACIAMWEMVR